MKPKILGPAVLAAAALMAFAGSASATQLTSPAGTSYTGTVKAKSIEPQVYVHYGLSELAICESELAWEVKSHAATATAKGPVTSFSLLKCGWNVTLLKPGEFEVHTWNGEANGSGLVTWTGAEITVNLWESMDCIYKVENPSWDPENPSIALLTSSKNLEGKTGTIDFEATWVRVGGSLFCPKAAELTAYYSVTSPDYLDVD